MLTLKPSDTLRPIALIKGGKLNGKIIYLDPDYDENKSESAFEQDFLDTLNGMFTGYRSRQKIIMMEKLRRAFEKNTEPVEQELAELFSEAKYRMKCRACKKIDLTDSEIQQIPNLNEREVIYVAGPSGSGKSTYVSKYAEQYKKLFPDNDIYVFSRLDNDKVIDNLKPIRITINEELVDDPMDPKELENSLVIFDDTTTIRDSKIAEAVRKFADDIMETGRHNNIHMCITNHLATDYKKTRTILNEANSITVFPKAQGVAGIRYMLNKYVGLTPQQITEVVKLPSRWITIMKTYPFLVLYEKGIHIL